MTTLVRPLVAMLLCSIVALGHAPAWWHVATCQDHSGGSHCCSVDGHDHIGHRHDHADPVESMPAEPNHHDAANCVTCQSLAAATGVTWDLIVLLPVDQTTEPLLVCPVAALPSESISVKHPRGPPAVV